MDQTSETARTYRTFGGGENPFRIGSLEEQMDETNRATMDMNYNIGRTPWTEPLPSSGGSLRSENPPGMRPQATTVPVPQASNSSDNFGTTVNDRRTMGTLQFRTWQEYLGLFSEDDLNLGKLWSSDLSKRDHVRLVLRRVEQTKNMVTTGLKKHDQDKI